MLLHSMSRSRVFCLERLRGEGSLAIGCPSDLVMADEITVLLHRSLLLSEIAVGSCLHHGRKRSVATARV